MSTPTTGRLVTSELRRYFSLSPRSSRVRHSDMVEAIHYAATVPGYFTDCTHEALRPAFGAALAYDKHVRGYRIPGEQAYKINSLSPWQFSALIGQMVDAGVTNTGEGERFFAALRQSGR